jgi:hypothetical protein
MCNCCVYSDRRPLSSFSVAVGWMMAAGVGLLRSSSVGRGFLELLVEVVVEQNSRPPKKLIIM